MAQFGYVDEGEACHVNPRGAVDRQRAGGSESWGFLRSTLVAKQCETSLGCLYLARPVRKVAPRNTR